MGTLSSTGTISTNSGSERGNPSSGNNSERASSVPKDIKESRNYEKKKQTKKRNSKFYDHTNPLEQEILALKAANNNSAKEDTKTDSNKKVKETNSVGVQVNLIQAAALTSQPSSPVPPSTIVSSSPAAASPSL